MCAHNANAGIALLSIQHTLRRVGEPETAECRYFYFDRAGRKQSPWHHIPLYAQPGTASSPHEPAGNIFNFVNEIPRGCVHLVPYHGATALDELIVFVCVSIRAARGPRWRSPAKRSSTRSSRT